MKRLLCLNRFVPPDAAPTARLLADLRSGLGEHGWQVDLLGGHEDYRTGRPAGLRRWLGELRTHLSLIRRALLSPKPDVVLCLTDPPGLPFTAAVIAWLRRAKLAHWVMDVYPEIAVALGEVKRDGVVHRLVRGAVRLGYRQCALIACLDEDMANLLGMRGDPRLLLCPPWPPDGAGLPESFPTPSPERIRWLYSGNLGRAHDFETLLAAQKTLEDAGAPFELVFQGGGTMRHEAMQRAAALGLQRCRWEDYAPGAGFLTSLMEAHVLVASQLPSTRGMIWPSKLAVMRHLPRPIVWIGVEDGAIARMLREADPQHGIFPPGQHAQLARWLLDRTGILRHPPAAPPPADLAARLAHEREGLLELWRERLDTLVHPCLP